MSCSSSNGTAAIVRPSGLMATSGGRSHRRATRLWIPLRVPGAGRLPGAARARGPPRRAAGPGGSCPRGSPGIRPADSGSPRRPGGPCHRRGAGPPRPCSMVSSRWPAGSRDQERPGCCGPATPSLRSGAPRHRVDQRDAVLLGQEHGQVVARDRHRAAGGAARGRRGAGSRPVCRPASPPSRSRRPGLGRQGLGDGRARRGRIPARRPAGPDPTRSAKVVSRRPSSTSHCSREGRLAVVREDPEAMSLRPEDQAVARPRGQRAAGQHVAEHQELHGLVAEVGPMVGREP